MDTIDIPSGFARCDKCAGDGISPWTTEKIEALPDFHPKVLPCSDCARRAMGIEPYSIWYQKR